MGTPPASGECHTRLAGILTGLEGVVRIKDYHGRGREHDGRLRAVLQRFKDFDITLRRVKCQLGKPEVKWFGNIFSKQ